MQTGINAIDSKVIHTLRFPLICLVVCVHSFSFIKGWSIDDLDLKNLSGADIYSLFGISLSMTLAHIAVPTFFLISGFLFFKGFENCWNWEKFKGKMRKRIFTLLIPYLIWNTICIITRIFPYVGGGGILNNVEGSVLTDWWHNNHGILMYYHAKSFVERINWFGGEGLLSFPILVPMWYVRDLIVLLLLAPLIYWTIQKKTYFLIIVIIYVTGLYPFVPGLSPSPLLFFSVGAFLSVKGYSLTGSIRQYRYPVYVVFAVLWIILVPLGGYRTVKGNYFYPFFIMAGVVSIINFFSHFVVKEEEAVNRNKLLAFFRDNENSCFFIYAAHVLVLPYFSNAIKKICLIITNDIDVQTVSFADQHPVLLIVCYLLKIVMVIVFCILCSRFLQLYMSRVYSLLTGR